MGSPVKPSLNVDEPAAPPGAARAGKLSIALARSLPRKLGKRRAILRLLPALTPGDVCIDIGTGHGGLAHDYAGSGAWTFCDVNEGNLAVARTILEGEFFRGNVTDLLRTKRDVSLVTCVDSLYYFPDPHAILAEIRRCLRPGGKLLVVGVDRQPAWIARWHGRLGSDGGVGAVSDTTLATLPTLLARAGFRVCEVAPFYGPTALVLQSLVDARSASSETGGDALTSPDLARDASLAKELLCRLVRPFSLAAAAVDAALFRRHAYAYALLAEAAPSPG